MGDSRRDKEYLGIDTNVLVAFLDDDHPDNPKTRILAEHQYNAVNPTVIHEAYHTLVYRQKWRNEVAKDTLYDYIDLNTTLFLVQTEKITKLGLEIGTRYRLGGRDSLILANFISNSIEKMITFDKELLQIKQVMIEEMKLLIEIPADHP